MNLSRYKNTLRKNFVVKLLTKKPTITNTEINQKLKFKYGFGMDSGRINKCRKLTAKRTLDVPKPMKSDKDIHKVTSPFPTDIQKSLEALKGGIKQHYAGGLIYLNVDTNGVATVKYVLQPKQPVPTTGKLTL